MMQLESTVKYDSKERHLLDWGLNRFVDDRMRIGHTSIGGSVERLPSQSLSQLKPTDRILQFGNPWVSKTPSERRFNHPDTVIPRVSNYYFWDNPELPHLLYKDAWNPHGHKNWMRLVPGGILSGRCDVRQERVLAINDQIRYHSDGKHMNWQSIVPKRRRVEVRGKRVLLILSSNGVYKHYDNLDKWQWAEQVQRILEARGYTVEVRDKMGRARRRRSQERLSDLLYDTDWAFSVSYQSAAVMESLLAGTAAVTWNRRDCGGWLTTPWQEMLEGNIRHNWRTLDVDLRVEQILSNTFHKQEAYTGEWYYGQ